MVAPPKDISTLKFSEPMNEALFGENKNLLADAFKLRSQDEIILVYLLLSRISRVRLCATPEMAAHQAPPSLGFSRQEHWSGLPFPSPVYLSGP